jgi:hypothetical protein
MHFGPNQSTHHRKTLSNIALIYLPLCADLCPRANVTFVVPAPSLARDLFMIHVRAAEDQSPAVITNTKNAESWPAIMVVQCWN